MRPVPSAHATKPASPKRCTAPTTTGCGSSRNGLAQIPSISALRKLRCGASASSVSAAATTLPACASIGSSSVNSSADRSTYNCPRPRGLESTIAHALGSPQRTPSMLQTSRGSASNLLLMTRCAAVPRMQCWCLLQAEVEDARGFDVSTKWLNTRQFSRHVAIRRQVLRYTGFTVDEGIARSGARAGGRLRTVTLLLGSVGTFRSGGVVGSRGERQAARARGRVQALFRFRARSRLAGPRDSTGQLCQARQQAFIESPSGRVRMRIFYGAGAG
jgi:hypothetical protein